MQNDELMGIAKRFCEGSETKQVADVVDDLAHLVAGVIYATCDSDDHDAMVLDAITANVRANLQRARLADIKAAGHA